MKVLTYILVTALLVCGSWIGSDFNTKHQLSKLPPKNQTINQYQTTENHNTSVQESSQAQITIVSPMTNFSVNYNGRTNIVVTKTSVTNTIKKTNR
jgi:hypothetical protein